MHPTRRSCVLVALGLTAGFLVVAAPRAARGPEPVWGQTESPWAGPVCVQRVSVSSSGEQGHRASRLPSLSDDGQRLTFVSWADNLVSGDTNGNWDVFLHDRASGQTRLVGYSVDGLLDGETGAGDAFLSGDARTVAYSARISSAAPGAPTLCSALGNVPFRYCVFAFDLTAGTLELVDVQPGGGRGNGHSRWPALSLSGGLVGFWSTSGDLVAGDTNAVSDAFARDRTAKTTARVSLTTFGSQRMGASGDADGTGENVVAISRDGRYEAFVTAASDLTSGDTNGAPDVILRDRLGGVTARVSLGDGGAQANGPSYLGARQAISDNGRYVLFGSSASSLVSGDTNGAADLFLRDRSLGDTERVSVSDTGAQGDGGTFVAAALSADARYVAFASLAENLVGGDDNGLADVFVRDRTAGRTVRVSLGPGGIEGNGAVGLRSWQGVSMSADGLAVAFYSEASNLVAGDTNGAGDVFVAQPCALLPTPTATTNPYPGPTSTPRPPTASATLVRTATPTATVTPTGTRSGTRTATATVTRTQAAYPGPKATATPAVPSCVCSVVQRRVPPVVVADALANPRHYYGWLYPLDPGKPPGPANPPRTCLTLQNAGVDYHPLWNKPVWRVGCR